MHSEVKVNSRRATIVVVLSAVALVFLAWGLFQLALVYWAWSDSENATIIELRLAVCKAVAPDVVAERDYFDADFIIVRAPNEDVAPIVDGELSEFKKQHSEPIIIRISNEKEYIGSFLIDDDKHKYVARLCEVVYS